MDALVPFTLRNKFHNVLASDERLIDVDGKLVRIKQGYKPDGKGGTVIGFGASLYDCSLVMLHYLLNNVSIVKDKTVLELGCGTGFLSIAVGIIGASMVVVTDGDLVSLDIVRQNISGNTGRCGELSNVIPLKLFWGNKADQIEVYRTFKERSTFPDLIIACDVAAIPYADAYATLVQTLRDNCSDRTVVLLGYQRRHASEDSFFQLLAEHFSICRIPESAIHQDFANSNIILFTCRRLSGDIDNVIALT